MHIKIPMVTGWEFLERTRDWWNKDDSEVATEEVQEEYKPKKSG